MAIIIFALSKGLARERQREEVARGNEEGGKKDLGESDLSPVSEL